MFVYEYYYMISHNRHMYVIAVSGNRQNLKKFKSVTSSVPEQQL